MGASYFWGRVWKWEGGKVLNTLQKILFKVSRKGIKCAYIAYNGGILSSFIRICLFSNISFSGCLNILASSNQLFLE